MGDIRELLQNVGTIIVIVLVLWFLGQDFLGWSGLDRPVRAVLRGIMQLGRCMVWGISLVFGWVGYHLILGRDMPATVKRFPFANEPQVFPADLHYVPLTMAVPLSPPSDDETDRQTVARNPDINTNDRGIPKYDPEKLLTLYTLLRMPREVKREEARVVLNALGIPLNNNMWRDAAPPLPVPVEESQLTPIAGRATKATFPE